MNKFNNKGLTGKAGATQETITAQNSTNQGDKILGLFNENDFKQVLNHFRMDFVTPGFYLNYFKQADRMISKARMCEENKNFIRGAFAMLASLVQWDNRQPFEWIAERYYPSDLVETFDDCYDEYCNGEKTEEEFEEAKADLLNETEYEVGCLMTSLWDVIDENSDGYYDEDIRNAFGWITGYRTFVEDHMGMELSKDTYREIQRIAKESGVFDE